MRWLALGVVLLVGCVQTEVRSGVEVRAEGRSVIVESDRALRALLVEIEWGADLEVSGVRAGEDAARLSVFETDWQPGATARRARVVLADGRGVRVPARGVVVTVEGTGTGEVRVVRAEAVDEGKSSVDVAVGGRP